ncbi:hypothetical protein DACRYDRAFT_99224 [Dacryopinax primogenitus]|uniref:C2H2-type domain-containing protein n=1 Tax=Dacryopinax primogenitus (strain DJM 731) TaxID=1858805 RepID=M5GEW5_DACPD|nr:uncharacterized protein DACRYDRAFT_99224 [Dacryopinax primogenitus]EJU03638.1 hypothetical protein DACRYDRAFT_99224 [Dacryopinax primogenitus]
MALICEPSPFILSTDDASSSSVSQLCLSSDPFDPSVFALYMAWPSSSGQQQQQPEQTGGGSTGSSRGGNGSIPLSPLSAYTGTTSSGGTPPSRLTPGSSNSSALSYASSAPRTGLDNATRSSAPAEFQLLHPSGRANGASPYPAPYGYRPAQNIEEGTNPALYHPASAAAPPRPSHPFSNTTSSPSTYRGSSTSQSSREAQYYSPSGALYPVSPPELLSPSWGQLSLCDFQPSFDSGPGTYDPVPYGSLSGSSGPSPYSNRTSQMAPGLHFTFPHGPNSTPSGDSANDPSPSPHSSGSDSPIYSGSSSGLSRHRSPSRAHDPNVSFLPPVAHIRKRPRRKADEIERIYICGFDGCQKSYGTLNHLNAHVRNASHGEKRRPEEFREIRNAWKRRKAHEAQEAQAAAVAAQAAEDQRQRASGAGMTGPSGMRSAQPVRRPTGEDYASQGFMAHRQQHAPGLGLPPMPQLAHPRVPGPSMDPQGYPFPPSLPSASLSPYSTRGPSAPWTPADRPSMVSPYMESPVQDPNQYFGQPIRVPQTPSGFAPAGSPRGPQSMLDYPSRQGTSGTYPPYPRDSSRQ